ncbi:DNA translocase FtsK [Candidatus Falkowbacteria bacterium]|nr:DNA translocase FtsK [Candidatus Falkowbacteria bacterium]
MPKIKYTKNEKNEGRKSNRRGTSRLNPETRRGILIVFLFALAGISILSLFNLAGGAGEHLEKALASFFGLGRFAIPIIFLALGYIILNGEKYELGASNYIGLFFLILSTESLLHLSFSYNDPFSFTGLSEGGGYLGLTLSYPLLTSLGSVATTLILLAVFISSILLTFNTSLHKIAEKGSFWKKIYQNIKLLFLGMKFNDRPEESPADGEGEQEPAEAAPATAPAFEAKNLPAETSDQSALPEASPMIVKVARKKIDLPLDLLDDQSEKPTSGDIKTQMNIIQKTLENFGIIVEMGDISVGPTVTQYTLKPADGVKLTKITSLHNDLALALAAHPIRIEAPIPGKSLVGIEVPNQKVAAVNLKEILRAQEFKQRKTNLTVALGKDVSGKVWVSDLGKMPHLLVAGSTGSGKSVCLNTIIVSLLYQNSPDDLRMIMVDPKRVEFTVYNGIPHLLTPVITDTVKTVNALKWVIGEMDRRFELLSKHGKRDIGAFNRETGEKMPYLVLIIDELADLMVVAAAEVEAAIIRLAQMARAVGIHLILATQRPSVNIITGLIKANITTRIAFAVASNTDSRTILDTSGAEKLLGRGDMLYTCPDLGKPKRLQGALVRDHEIKKVIDYLKNQDEPEYLEEVTQKPTFGVSIPGLDLGNDSDDELLSDAKEVIVQAGKASASLLQRRLKVGYARAARLLDLMEEQGIIGPADGAKPRDILIAGVAAPTNSYNDNNDNLAEEEDPEENA